MVNLLQVVGSDGKARLVNQQEIAEAAKASESTEIHCSDARSRVQDLINKHKPISPDSEDATL